MTEQPIYTPPSPPARERGLLDLIKLEWEIIDKLREEAQKAKFEKHKAQFYLAISSHARTLSVLLREAGIKTEDTKDLAVLLKEISKKAKKFWKRRSRP